MMPIVPPVFSDFNNFTSLSYHKFLRKENEHLNEEEYFDFIKTQLRDVFITLLKTYLNLLDFEPDASRKEFITSQYIKHTLAIIDELKNCELDNKTFEFIRDYSEVFIKAIKTKNEVLLGFSKSILLNKSFKYKYNSNVDFKDFTRELLTSLKKGGLISNSTNISQFHKLFTNTTLNNKILWTGDMQQFKYFINKLVNHPKVESIYRDKWKVALNCFSVLDKKRQPVSNTKISTQKETTNKKKEKIDSYLNL